MKQITFVTGNKRKVMQAQVCLEPFGITVDARDLDVVEIQSHDPEAISVAKARAAFEVLRQPLVICDHSWAFLALNGFPGGYMKDMNGWFTAEDFLRLMDGKQDRRVVLTETVVYVDTKQTKVFASEFTGTVTNEPRGVGYVPCEQVVVFDGQHKTIAENIDSGDFSRDMQQSAWMLFGEWYKGK